MINKVLLILTYIMYSLVFIVRSKITADTVAGIILMLFIVSVIYQIMYIIHFRKKENVKFGAALANVIFGIVTSLNTLLIMYNIYIAFFGYKVTDFVGNHIETLYGFEAIFDTFNIIITVPCFVIFTVYQICYLRKQKSKKTKN